LARVNRRGDLHHGFPHQEAKDIVAQSHLQVDVDVMLTAAADQFFPVGSKQSAGAAEAEMGQVVLEGFHRRKSFLFRTMDRCRTR
jgi:hypothetical protein